MPESLIIRASNITDCDLFYNIRNLPEIRNNSNDSSEIDYQTHKTWFENSLKNENRLLLAIVYSNEIIGSIRFDFNETTRSALVSIYISPKFWGKGLSKKSLISSEKLALSKWRGIKQFDAEVLPHNHVSKKIFEDINYVLNGNKYTKRI